MGPLAIPNKIPVTTGYLWESVRFYRVINPVSPHCQCLWGVNVVYPISDYCYSILLAAPNCAGSLMEKLWVNTTAVGEGKIRNADRCLKSQNSANLLCH